MVKGRFVNSSVAEQIRNPSSLAELAYQAIREAIITGQIGPNERLLQEDLAEELGVSPRTVREALKQLVAEGLASSEAYKGVSVAFLPIEELADAYDVRAVLEGMAMESAAERVSEDDLCRMRELLPQSAPTTDIYSAVDARAANREFHWIAIRGSGRKQLIRSLAMLWDTPVAYVEVSRRTDDQRAAGYMRDLKDHSALLEALEARNPLDARRVAEAHVRATLRDLKARLGGAQDGVPA